MILMNEQEMAKEVLIRARKEILRELALCGQNGGVGRSQNYAPILVNIHQAINVIDEMENKVKADFGERMKAAREAKAAAK